jgi:hypothetical protein
VILQLVELVDNVKSAPTVANAKMQPTSDADQKTPQLLQTNDVLLVTLADLTPAEVIVLQFVPLECLLYNALRILAALQDLLAAPMMLFALPTTAVVASVTSTTESPQLRHAEIVPTQTVDLLPTPPQYLVEMAALEVTVEDASEPM